MWNANIVRDWGATSASTVTYVTPVVGILLGTVVLGERLTWSQPLGAAVVLVGILLSQGKLPLFPRRLRPERRASPDHVAPR
ncbi:DMT family transporter [Microbacterium aurantiacum]|uniref:DMT family transporter n=1 Tax=Microbacterium aurantiacum TaxID=162393 RepID=UPI0027E15638|nr:DMT family transporter [Microbacterium aurantiacum]